jgi:hypothetical protein
MHYGLVQVLKSIIKDVGIPDIAVVTEARGLRSSDASRPGDVVVLDFFRDGQHLVIDAVVTTVYRNTVFHQVSTIPGYAAKQAEDRKFYADKSSAEPVASIHGGPHVLVPFALEDGGRLGAHAQALLRSFAALAVDKGRRPPLAYRDSSFSAPTLVSIWVQRWQQRLSSWMHLALSKQVLRILCPDAAARQSYI